ncbi:MAG: glycosyltransferase [Cohaesibacter sp.]|jgi:cellulose synthase/poly-beta-1,6-N-acetylglucosamine synthase-like glycosyltransferase|nr:glycosyltransferase [Cohaesibacter sp.]
MNFVSSTQNAPLSSNLALKTAPNDKEQNAREGSQGSVFPDGLPFHLSLLQTGALTADDIAQLSHQAFLREQQAGGKERDFAQHLMASGQLSPQLYYALAAKKLGIGFVPSLAGEQICLPQEALICEGLEEVDWILTDPFPKGQGFAPSPNRALVMAPKGEALDRLADKLAQLPDLEQDLYLTTPAALRHGLRSALSQKAFTEKVYHLRDTLPHLSAHPVIPKLQAIFICLALFCLVFFSFLSPALALALNFAGITIFLAMAFLRFAAFRHARRQTHDSLGASGPAPPSSSHSTEAFSGPSLTDPELWPSYAVMVPLYREGSVLADLVASLSALDYPQSRLRIYLIIEDDDEETRAALSSLSLPARFEVVIVPENGPRTKPKALNYALSFINSDLSVIFDAEDRPAPDQLKQAARAMIEGGDRLACLQGRLAIDNGAESWLSRQFSIEYSALFDGLLPFLAHEKLPIPLGGTSNHFRTSVLKSIGGWDPYNVTEDADLGLRLSHLGYEIGVIRADTQEEAPIRYKPWMKQRSRWFKGWMQTWLVHMRRPFHLYKNLGRSGFLSFHIMIGGMLVSSLIHPAYLLGLAASAFAIWQGAGDDNPAFWALLFTNGLNLLLGYGSAMLLAHHTSRQRFGMGLRHILSMPLYWLLMTPSAWRAFYQLLFDPHHWEKTPHGLSKGRPAAAAAYGPNYGVSSAQKASFQEDGKSDRVSLD